MLATWTLSDVFGAGHVYVPAPSYAAPGWLPPERAALDFLTGAQLPIAGDFPVVCHRAVATPAILSLLEEAGHPRPRRLRLYDGAESHQRRLDELAAEGLRVVLQHTQPPGVVADERLWIPRSVLDFVNNKRNLLELVPEGHAPERRVVAGCRLAELGASQPLRAPVVLKAAEDLSSGAGYGVRICRTRPELSRAIEALGGAAEVVIETMVDFAVSWCVQLLVTGDGAVRPIGAAEQICDPSGRYRGNWLSSEPVAPDEVADLAAEIATRVAERGYRGCLGIDVGATAEGRLLAFDLNGRFNGSSVALSVFESLARAGARCARYGTWSSGAGFEALERTTRTFMRRGRLVPLALYDPRSGDGSALARVSGLVLGESREEVARVEKELAAAGLG